MEGRPPRRSVPVSRRLGGLGWMDENIGAIKVQLTDEDPRAIEAGSGAVTKLQVFRSRRPGSGRHGNLDRRSCTQLSRTAR